MDAAAGFLGRGSARQYMVLAYALIDTGLHAVSARRLVSMGVSRVLRLACGQSEGRVHGYCTLYRDPARNCQLNIFLGGDHKRC